MVSEQGRFATMTTALAKRYTRDTLTTIEGELAALDGWAIDTTEDNELAGELLKDVKRRHKELEGKRTEITVPMNAAIKAVNSLFRAPREALEQGERILKVKISEWLARVEQANHAHVALAAAADSPEEASEQLAAVIDTAPPKGVAVRHVWRATVTSAAAVPRAFLVPDVKAIEAWAKGQGAPAVAGVTFTKEAIVSARS